MGLHTLHKATSLLALATTLLMTSGCSPDSKEGERSFSAPDRIREAADSFTPKISMDTLAETAEIREQNTAYLKDLADGAVTPAQCKSVMAKAPTAVSASSDAATASSAETLDAVGTAITVGVYKTVQNPGVATREMIGSCPESKLETPNYLTTQRYSSLPRSATEVAPKECSEKVDYYRLSVQTAAKKTPDNLPMIGIYYGAIAYVDGVAYEMRIGNENGIEVDPVVFAKNVNELLRVSQCKR